MVMVEMERAWTEDSSYCNEVFMGVVNPSIVGRGYCI